MGKPTGLVSIFMELGLSRRLAQQAAKRLDGLRLKGWQDDDWASALLLWRSEHAVATQQVARELRQAQRAHLIDVPGQAYLF